MKIIIAISVSLCLFSCGNQRVNQTEGVDSLKTVDKDSMKRNEFDYEGQFKLEKYLANDQPDTATIQVIDFNCSLIIDPSSDQVDEMKKRLSEEDLSTIADDNLFYQWQAKQLIDSAGVKAAAAKKRFIKFIGTDKSWVLDIRKKDLPAWNLILFNRKKDPQPVSTTSLTFEKIKEFFEK